MYTKTHKSLLYCPHICIRPNLVCYAAHTCICSYVLAYACLNKMYGMMCNIHNCIYEHMYVCACMFNVQDMYMSIYVYLYYTPFIYSIYRAVCTD